MHKPDNSFWEARILPIQIGLCIALMVALAGAKFLGLRFWITFAITGTVGIPAVFLLRHAIFSRISKSTDAKMKEIKAMLAQVQAEAAKLSLEEAKTLATQFLQNGDVYEIKPAVESSEFRDLKLGPATTEFFQTYMLVRHIDVGGVGQEYVQKIKCDGSKEDWIQIGEGDEDFILLIQAGKDDVFELEPGGSPELVAPTVYHWFVQEHRLQFRVP